MFQQLRERFFQSKSGGELSLTAKEIDLIRQTWLLLRSDIAGFRLFGSDLFIRFFSKYPDYQRQFKSFKDIPITFGTPLRTNPMRVNKKLMTHGTYVMYTLGMLVDNLENPELLEQMLIRLARNHYRRKINITAFEQLKDAFLEQLLDKIGPEIFNKKATQAWRKTFEHILNVLDREFNHLDSDILKKGSYFQLETIHRNARKSIRKSRPTTVNKTANTAEPEEKSKRFSLLKNFSLKNFT